MSERKGEWTSSYIPISRGSESESLREIEAHRLHFFLCFFYCVRMGIELDLIIHDCCSSYFDIIG